jgi:hypothetical protein
MKEIRVGYIVKVNILILFKLKSLYGTKIIVIWILFNSVHYIQRSRAIQLYLCIISHYKGHSQTNLSPEMQ